MIARSSFALALAQSSLRGTAPRCVAAATERAAVLDLRGATDAVWPATHPNAPAAAVASWYLRGLIAAREAYQLRRDLPESL